MAGVDTHSIAYTYTDEQGCENFAEQTITVDACTGVPEDNDLQIIAVPNPTNGSFKLSLSGKLQSVELLVINSIGKIVSQQNNVRVYGDCSVMIDLSGQASELYYIQVKGAEKTYFKKVPLQK